MEKRQANPQVDRLIGAVNVWCWQGDAVPRVGERIPAELATHPYLCRFIDTTTAAPWHECYHPDHPMTRTESREWKMELLRYVSEANRLVTGCETGHDAAVPFLHYFEGMRRSEPGVQSAMQNRK